MKKTAARFVFVFTIIAIIGAMGCKKDKKYIPLVETVTVTNTVTNTVTVTNTIHHYYYDVDVENPAGVVGYTFDDLGNSMFLGAQYGGFGFLVGSSDFGICNTMDVGFLSFDLGSLGQPANSVLTTIALHLYSCSSLAENLTIYVTSQNPPVIGDCAAMVDSIYGGAVLGQEIVFAVGDYFIDLDPLGISLFSDILYLGIYSDAVLSNPLQATFDEYNAYVLLEYILQE